MRLMLKIRLPERPPPLSACFTDPAGRKGRVKTKRYRDWEKICAPKLKEVRGYLVHNRVASYQGDVAVQYRFARTDRRKRDLGNLEKAMSDILVKHEIIEDDSKIVDLRLVWGGDEPAEIWIWECEKVETE